MPRLAHNKRNLTEIFLQRVRPQSQRYLVWDTTAKGLALQIRPNGQRAWKFVYSFHRRVRWYHIGDASAWGLADARIRARELRVEVDRDNDPQAARRAKRSSGTLAELAARYLEEHAKKHNKSWKQADYLVRKHLLPNLGQLKSASITHDDGARTVAAIKAPVVANQTLVAGSAIFSWAIRKRIDGVKENPFTHIERNKVVSRERVLSDGELPRFWAALEKAGPAGAALKTILLLGQRPGEVGHMRWEQIVDGWWEMPGKPVGEWPGTKNGENHRVWLPQPMQALLGDRKVTGFVFGRAITNLDLRMRAICKQLEIEDKVTPHDLRRTHGTKITGLGFGRDAMNRIQNHKEGGIASVYDRHQYADENKRIMEAVAAHILNLATGE